MSFTYDGDGNRISKGTVSYINDVNLPLTQVLLEQDESGNTLASYTYGLELISMTKGGNIYYYIYDGLGNVVAVTDETGQTIQTYDYDAFGNVISTTGELTNPYQFIGAYGCANDGVGLIYMRARYYAPETGRFISRDPWEGSIHEPLSLNRYIYVENNPASHIDPEGEWSIRSCWRCLWGVHKSAEKCEKKYPHKDPSEFRCKEEWFAYEAQRSRLVAKCITDELRSSEAWYRACLDCFWALPPGAAFESPSK